MEKKKRYLIGHGYSTTVPQDVVENVKTYLSSKRAIKKVRKLQTGQRIVEMTEEEAIELSAEHPDLVIEEDSELEMFLPMPGLNPSVPSDAELSLNIKVVDAKTKKPVSDVTLYCIGDGVTYKGLTDDKGTAVVTVYERDLRHIIASPKDTYWSKVSSVKKLKPDMQIRLELQKIDIKGDYDWGHLLIGVENVGHSFKGKGVKIAIIDSGISEHEDLITKGGFNTLDGQDVDAWNVDSKGHGTHCCGVIAAQPNKIGITGMAPEAEIYSLKVFPGGRFSDLIEAINWCIDNYMDVISMSLGSKRHSVLIENVITEANERGITCIAAAGNHGGEVSYPAKYENVIAVAAIGKLGTFPKDSAHTLKIGSLFSYDGEIFFANFSNFGPQIDVCAPGVAILSSVPSGYASWDGTSMACPIISGIAALILEAYPEIRTGDAWQPYYVREALTGSATDIGLPVEMQGAGLPSVAVALAEAHHRREYQEEIITSYIGHMEAMLKTAKIHHSHLEQALAKLDAI